MATQPRKRAAKRPKPSGKLVPLNPWIPAIPVKGAKGKTMVTLVLGIPLVFVAGVASGAPLPNRSLHVPVELTRQALSLREFEQWVAPLKNALLGKYDARVILVQKGGK